MIRFTRRAVLALGLFVAACASPTLPLPPPAVPTVTPSTTAGKVHLASRNGAEANAIIVVVNKNPSVPLDQRVSGAQADGSGSWDCDAAASSGDVLEVTQEFESTRSPPVDVQVP
jgi:hypothetical protein